MPVSLSNLILHVGDNVVEFQPLDKAITNMVMKKRESLYTFTSSVPFSLDGPDMLGMVVWLNRDQAASFLSAKEPNFDKSAIADVRSIYLALLQADASKALDALSNEDASKARELLGALELLFDV